MSCRLHIAECDVNQFSLSLSQSAVVSSLHQQQTIKSNTCIAHYGSTINQQHSTTGKLSATTGCWLEATSTFVLSAKGYIFISYCLFIDYLMYFMHIRSSLMRSSDWPADI
jgi:hypothetical protein